MSAGRASTVLLAAAGDVGAQRAVANQAYEQFLAADEGFKETAAAKCLIFARLAAAAGTTSDSEILVFVFARLGEWQAERGNKDMSRRLNAAGLNLADALANMRSRSNGGHGRKLRWNGSRHPC